MATPSEIAANPLLSLIPQGNDQQQAQPGTQGGAASPFLPGEAPNDPLQGGALGDPSSFLEAGLGGAVAAGMETKDAAVELTGNTPGPKSPMRQAIENRTNALVQQAPVVNGLAKGIAQFGVGFVGLGKVLKPLKMAGKLYDAARGAAVGAVAFDPHEARLSNLVEEFPSLQNPVTQFLAARPDDSQAVARFRSAVENLVLPGVAEAGIAGTKAVAKGSVNVLTKLVDAVRLRRAGDIKGANAAVQEADAALAKTGGLLDESGAEVGGPNDPPGAGPGGAPTADTAAGGGGVLGDAPEGAPPSQGDQVGPGAAGAPEAPGGQPAVGADTAADEPAVTVPRELPRDNFLKPLTTYTKRLWREESPNAALEAIPGSGVSGGAGPMGPDRKFYADTPDLALGQGTNKGVRIEYDAAAFQGKINKKPGWEIAFQGGAAEYEAMPVRGANPQRAIRAIDIQKDALTAAPKWVQTRYKNTIQALKENGWGLTETDEGYRLSAPKASEPATAPQPTLAPESIRAAALRSASGEVFEGTTHGDAATNLFKAGQQLHPKEAGDGFVTSSGRFVNRDEALDIAEKAHQLLDPTKTHANRPDAWLHAKDLNQATLSRVPSSEPTPATSQLPPRVDLAPEEVQGLIKKAQADTGAILDAGSYDAAAADGHAFAQTDLIPWQKIGEGGEEPVDAWMRRVVSEQEPFIQKQRGGNAEGVLKDRSVNRMIDARVAAFGEDPAMLRGLILQAGDKARTMAANMETAYVIAQKGMQDTYGLAMRISAGNIEGFESIGSAEAALKSRLQSTLEMFGAAKTMTAAAGRSLRRMRGEFKVHGEQLQKLNIDNVDPHALTKLIMSTQGNPKAMSQLAKPGFISQAVDALTTMQAANLLWGWSSQVINMGMNVATLYQRPFTQWVGGKALQVVGLAARKQSLLANAGAASNIARRQMVTTHTYLYDAWKAASWSFLNGDSGLAPHTANEFTGSTQQGVTRPGVQPVEQLVNMWRDTKSIDDVAYNAMVSVMNTMSVPLRVMGAADEFTKTLRYRAVVASKADADALAQGMTPGTTAYKNYIEQRVRDAFDENGGALDVDALQEAKVTTFSQDLLGSGTEDTVAGWKSMGSLVQQGVNAVPPARLILPFVKTPTNLFRYGWRLTPGVNLLQKQYLNALTGNSGPEAQAMATGEMMLGVMLASTAIGLRLSGKITGGGPADYKSAKAWKDDGNRPYSFVTTNKDGTQSFTQFSRLDPLQAPLAMAADAADLMLQGHLTEDQQSGLAMSIVLALSHQLKNKTYLQNIVTVLDGLADDNKMQNLPQRLAPGFLPFSTLLQGATQMQDPILHEVHGVIDALKSRTPGFSDEVPPHRDWGGDVVLAPGKFLADQKLPAPLARALNDTYQATGTYMQPPSPRTSKAPGVDLRDVTLDGGRNAYDRYQELAGNPTGKMPLKDVLGRLVQTDAYKVLPHGRMSEEGTKENALHKVAEQFRQAGMGRLLAESKTMRDLTMQRHHDLLGQLQTNVKDLRAAKAKGAAEGLNALLQPYGFVLPVPSANIPGQQ